MHGAGSGALYELLGWRCMAACGFTIRLLQPHPSIHGSAGAEAAAPSFACPCSNTDGMEVRSVGNSQTLKETALIEAFNLKVGATPRQPVLLLHAMMT